ncbi:pickpocket protein 28-like [Nilaparvata lugens]|uniref:pickpocket protein 28-like n=1 Tax=Nilaparvata lugens TaxID=108931 RepID=UPI00193D86E6|nr:pickpocket protein 28-like [Nilaparvata lugens]
MKMNEWKEDPMTIELANTLQHISTLPYPAFTLCGPLRVANENVEYLLKKLDGDGNYKIADILGMPVRAFDEMFNMSSTGNSSDSNRERFFISYSSLETFLLDSSLYHYPSISPPFYSGPDRPTFLFRELCWSSNILPASKIYKMNTAQHHLDLEIRNRHGLNIQLNTDMINGFPSYTEHWSQKRPYYFIPRPLKIPVLEVQSDITYHLHEYEEEDKFIGRDKGYRFTIHNPWDVPSPFMRWHRFQPSKDSRILIEPELIIKYPVNENDFLYKVPYAKQCYNTTEKTLDFFQYYTRQNCLMECSTKRALRECGCVLFYMPHNESTYICSDEYSSCAVDVAKATHYDTGDRKFVDPCDCLPSCNYIDYKVISYETEGIESLDSKISYSKIEFRDVFFYPKVRSYTYNNNDMMDATVVYLDVFLGVSIMTVAEIFYYILLYVIDYLKRKIQRMFDWLYMS